MLEQQREATEREASERAGRVERMAAELQAARKKRLTEAKFRAARFEGLDGQCLGQGKPQYGYTIQGSLYVDNVVVGNAAGCAAFGPDDNNITNFFCCKSNNLPEVLEISVSAENAAP